MNKIEAIEAYREAEKLNRNSMLDEFLAVFPDPESLDRFRIETGKFSWPGSYGESPWEFASNVAYIARDDLSFTNPHYIEPGQASHEMAVLLRERWGKTPFIHGGKWIAETPHKNCPKRCGYCGEIAAVPHDAICRCGRAMFEPLPDEQEHDERALRSNNPA